MREITPITGKETSGKLNLSLVPPEIVNAVAHIREYGCQKYDSPDNWKDDSLVASEIIEKFWSDIPGIWIRIEEL